MGSDRMFMQRDREHAESPLNRAVGMIRTELNLHPDTTPGMVAIKTLDAINALRTLHDIEHPDCDGENYGEDCPARLALLGTTPAVQVTEVSDTAFTGHEVALTPDLVFAPPPQPHPLVTMNTSGPVTLALPVVPYRPVLDGDGNVQYDTNGKMIQSPDAPAAPVHVVADKHPVVITGRRGNQALTLLAGMTALFEWESRPPGWCLTTIVVAGLWPVGAVEEKNRAADCDCPTPQLGWATAECATCGGHVSYGVYCAAYPGKTSDPRDPDQVKAAIAKARAAEQR